MSNPASKHDGKNKGPLVGLRVLVTRAHGESSEKLSHLLEQAGAKPIEVPVIYFGEPTSFDGLDNALRKLGTYNWVIFASANAVSSVMARAEGIKVPFKKTIQNSGSQNKDPGSSLKQSGSIKVAAIGRATADKLLSYGIETDYVPSSFVAESFLQEFPSIDELADAKILWPRTNVGRTLIAEALRERGAQVDAVEAYTTGLPPDAPLVARDIESKIDRGEIDIITLASAQTVKNLATLLTLGKKFDSDVKTQDDSDGGTHGDSIPQHDKQREYFIHRLAGVKIATIGPITSKAAREYLRAADIEATVFTAEGLVDALEKFFVPL